MNLTQKKLKDILTYSQDTGNFIWAISPSKNTKSGTIAGCVGEKGYVQISINNKLYKAHRLAWLYVNGYFPEGQVDHIDRNKANNNFSNLRVVSHSCNIRNTGVYKNNKSGVKGVFYRASFGKWVASINLKGKKAHLGYFETKYKAAVARHKAEIENNFKNCLSDSSALKFIKEQDEKSSIS